MKKMVIPMLIALFSLNALAQNKIAEIRERGTSRTLVFEQDKNQLIFSVDQNGLKREINRLDYNQYANKLELRGRQNNYNFKLLKKGFSATTDIFDWCFYDEGLNVHFGTFAVGGIVGAAMIGTAPIGGVAVLIGSAVAVCGVGPALPAAAGIALLPIDALITLGSKTSNYFHSENVAKRKMVKLISGENTKASPKVFKDLLNSIESL